MDNSQEFKKIELKDIKSIEQLVSSHLVAEVIVNIRENLEEKNQKTVEFVLPDLDIPVIEGSERARELYERAGKILKTKAQLIYMLKIGIEDLFNYNFAEDPSVVTAGANDIIHLNQMFGPRFADLRKISLLNHTLNVFEEGIAKAEHSGRASGMVIGVLGCLFHDFGKSTKIREKLLGTGMQRGYKIHAEVSEMYVQDLLLNKIYNILVEDIVAIDLIDSLAKVVKNHHPSSAKMKEDLEINFVIIADQEARKKEYRQIQRKK